ncbi:MAG TPA: DUF2231 domain-containing protein [Pseudoduganella sp.]
MRQDICNIDTIHPSTTQDQDHAMSAQITNGPIPRHPPGRLHAILLAGTVPLFLGALASDAAYYQTYQIQWSNFASWLIAGGLLFGGLALLLSVAGLLRARRKTGRLLTGLLFLLVTWVLGLCNAFVHAKDAWAAMPDGLILSVVVAALACIATWISLDTRPEVAK